MRLPIFPVVHWRKTWTGKAACDELGSGKVHEQVTSRAPGTFRVCRRLLGNYARAAQFLLWCPLGSNVSQHFAAVPRGKSGSRHLPLTLLPEKAG